MPDARHKALSAKDHRNDRQRYIKGINLCPNQVKNCRFCINRLNQTKEKLGLRGRFFSASHRCIEGESKGCFRNGHGAPFEARRQAGRQTPRHKKQLMTLQNRLHFEGLFRRLRRIVGFERGTIIAVKEREHGDQFAAQAMGELPTRKVPNGRELFEAELLEPAPRLGADREHVDRELAQVEGVLPGGDHARLLNYFGDFLRNSPTLGRLRAGDARPMKGSKDKCLGEGFGDAGAIGDRSEGLVAELLGAPQEARE